MSSLGPFRLHPSFAKRTWGRRSLAPWYPQSTVESVAGAEEPIGEAWLTGPDCVVNDGPYAGKTLAEVAKADTYALLGSASGEAEFPLLIKLLFPDAKLSVQVHPNDEEAHARGLGRGKTECWYVLEAAPGATVACGLKPGVAVDQMRDAIADGSMESLMQMIPVSKGDMVFVDAGTVHAIAPGVTLLEIQQTSDTTYRLFDYGRPRELHVEQGLAVSKTATRAGKVAPQVIEVANGGTPVKGTRLIKEQYFTVDSFALKAGDTLLLDDAQGKPHCLTALYGDAEVVAGDYLVMLPASCSVVVPASVGVVTIKAGGANLEVVRSMP
jgi:mannose-6-phosphate isomerase